MDLDSSVRGLLMEWQPETVGIGILTHAALEVELPPVDYFREAFDSLLPKAINEVVFFDNVLLMGLLAQYTGKDMIIAICEVASGLEEADASTLAKQFAILNHESLKLDPAWLSSSIAETTSFGKALISEIEYLNAGARPDSQIEKETRVMETSSGVRERLKTLEETKTILEEKRAFFEQKFHLTSSTDEKFSINQALKREILPALRKSDKEYAEILAELIDSTEVPSEIGDGQRRKICTSLKELAACDGVDDDDMKSINQAQHALEDADSELNAKLKMAIPIIPKLVHIEIEKNLGSTRIWDAWRALRDTLIGLAI